MPELLSSEKLFEYQVNIEDPIVIVALRVIRVLLIYSECFKYSKTTGMQAKKRVKEKIRNQ